MISRWLQAVGEVSWNPKVGHALFWHSTWLARTSLVQALWRTLYACDRADQPDSAAGSGPRGSSNDFDTIGRGGPVRLQRRNNGLPLGLGPMLARFEFAHQAGHGNFKAHTAMRMHDGIIPGRYDFSVLLLGRVPVA
jgi:hypothetical protein